MGDLPNLNKGLAREKFDNETLGEAKALRQIGGGFTYPRYYNVLGHLCGKPIFTCCRDIPSKFLMYIRAVYVLRFSECQLYSERNSADSFTRSLVFLAKVKYFSTSVCCGLLPSLSDHSVSCSLPFFWEAIIGSRRLTKPIYRGIIRQIKPLLI